MSACDHLRLLANYSSIALCLAMNDSSRSWPSMKGRSYNCCRGADGAWCFISFFGPFPPMLIMIASCICCSSGDSPSSLEKCSS